MRLIDTANCYVDGGREPGGNETLVREALASWTGNRSEVLVATKGGATRTVDGGWGRDGRPESLRRACDTSLRALGVERIGLYQLHQVDPEVPFADSVGALVDLVAEGKVGRIGVSNVSVDELTVAAAAGAVSVRAYVSIKEPDAGPTIPTSASLGLQVLAWAPLAGVRTDEDAAQHPAVPGRTRLDPFTWCPRHPDRRADVPNRSRGDHEQTVRCRCPSGRPEPFAVALVATERATQTGGGCNNLRSDHLGGRKRHDRSAAGDAGDDRDGARRSGGG